ncbi:MAG TPA: 2-dehydropantoate 2-reductase, partial [Caldilineaceae bacterium]|nr:2-dehydropantoate 2-reductase [Caldilineaceae bacterium]
MRVLIWGAGAIGGVIGAYLARAGHDVTFVDRVAEHVEAIRTRGLRITGPIDEFSVKAPACTPEAVSGVWQTIVLAVKAQDTEAATQALAPHLAADGCVISAQNGLNELTIARIVGPERTIGAFVNFGADYHEPGVILYGGRGAVVLGEMDGAMTPRLAELHKLFQDFEPDAIQTDNIWGYLWGKMGYGAQLFITALTNESIADALAMRDYRGLYIAIAQEVMRIAQAKGITPLGFNGFDPNAFMPGADPQAIEASFDQMVAFNRRSAKTHSGIWRDLAVRKRRTEVDAQLSPIVEEGRALGIEA